MQKILEGEQDRWRKAADVEQPPVKEQKKQPADEEQPEQKEQPEAKAEDQKEALKEKKSNKLFPHSALFQSWGGNLSEEDQKEAEALFKSYGYNVFLSDRLPLDRALQDTRDPRYSFHFFLLCKTFQLHFIHRECLNKPLEIWTWMKLHRAPFLSF